MGTNTGYVTKQENVGKLKIHLKWVNTKTNGSTTMVPGVWLLRHE